MIGVNITINNGCKDSLNGKPLKDGELLRVKWPDGSITEEKIVVESISKKSSVSGMSYTATPYKIITTKAYIKNEIKGLSCLIRLYDQNILCERI